MADDQFKGQPKRTIGLLVVVVLLIAALVPLTIYTVNYVNELRTKALPTETPREIEVTNLTGTSATISWVTTSLQTVGYVKYGATNDLDEVAFDKRDAGEASGEYTLHYVELTNLVPNTTYYYAIIVGGTEYTRNGNPYDFQTGPILETVRTPVPIKGEVDDPTGGTEELIVFMYARKGSAISNRVSVLTSNKRYTFDLTNLRTVDLSSAFTDFEDATITFFAEGAERGEGSLETKIMQL